MDPCHYNIDFLIVGGGLSGLSAANHFADLRAKALLIEANNFPTHKVCGEFISPDGLPYLNKWGIHPKQWVDQASIFSGDYKYSFSLPQKGASLSRFKLDHLLAKRAEENTIPVLIGKRVIELVKENEFFLAKLASGETIRAKNILISTGRIPFKGFATSRIKLPYYGIKAHFSGINLNNTLEMHLFTGGYLGLTNIEEGLTNLACIVKAQEFEKYPSPQAFMNSLLARTESAQLRERLSKAKLIFSDWLVTKVPEFSPKKTPFWENSYFIGDAAGGIPPATGDGIGMALSSGIMAAEYALKNDAKGFREAWNSRYLSRIRWGKLLHKIFLNPYLNKPLLRVCKICPSMASELFKRTREY